MMNKKKKKESVRIFEIVDKSAELKLELLPESEIQEMDEINKLREIVIDIENPPLEFYSST